MCLSSHSLPLCLGLQVGVGGAEGLLPPSGCLQAASQPSAPVTSSLRTPWQKCTSQPLDRTAFSSSHSTHVYERRWWGQPSDKTDRPGLCSETAHYSCAPLRSPHMLGVVASFMRKERESHSFSSARGKPRRWELVPGWAVEGTRGSKSPGFSILFHKYLWGTTHGRDCPGGASN